MDVQTGIVYIVLGYFIYSLLDTYIKSRYKDEE